MLSNTCKYPQPPFTQAIQLYGDRSGSKGTFKFAGFAWIQHTKVILVQGDEQSLNSASEWRCLLRLIALAHRLKKPIVLWNLPVAYIAKIRRKTTLACAQAIQRTELQLLRLPSPIITVFDGANNIDHAAQELIWNDGMVLVGLPDAQFSGQKRVKNSRASNRHRACNLRTRQSGGDNSGHRIGEEPARISTLPRRNRTRHTVRRHHNV